LRPHGRFAARPSTAQRSTTIAADQARVWAVIADPHQLPRWWPSVIRVEAVDAERWTQVHGTKRGRAVRLDFHLLATEPPSRILWEQEIAGTPLQRVLDEALTEIILEVDRAGTRVTIAQRQKLRGYSRTGGVLVRRGTERILQHALEGLSRACT
jgi:uncharacterized protein YndB with AHSA1/START domain